MTLKEFAHARSISIGEMAVESGWSTTALYDAYKNRKGKAFAYLKYIEARPVMGKMTIKKPVKRWLSPSLQPLDYL